MLYQFLLSFIYDQLRPYLLFLKFDSFNWRKLLTDLLTATVTFFSSGSLELLTEVACMPNTQNHSLLYVIWEMAIHLFILYTCLDQTLTIVTLRCWSNFCWRLFANGISKEVTGIKSPCLFATGRKSYQSCPFLFLNSKVSEGKRLSLLMYDNYLNKDWLFLKFWKRPTSLWPDIT